MNLCQHVFEVCGTGQYFGMMLACIAVLVVGIAACEENRNGD